MILTKIDLEIDQIKQKGKEKAWMGHGAVIIQTAKINRYIYSIRTLISIIDKQTKTIQDSENRLTNTGYSLEGCGMKKKMSHKKKQDTVTDNLMKSVKAFIETRGGKVIVFGPIQIMKWPTDREEQYTLTIKCSGLKPKGIIHGRNG